MALQLSSGVGWSGIAAGNSAEPLTMIPSAIDAYSLLQRAISKGDVPLVIDDMRKSLPLLSSGAEHWTGKSEHQRFEEWLLGRMPPPRCVAIDVKQQKRCLHKADSEGGLCRLVHKCLSTSHGGCEKQRKIDSEFCNDHRCQMNAAPIVCPVERMAGSAFCCNHSCPCCIVDGSMPIGVKSPFTCSRHRCAGRFEACNSGSSECNNRPLLPHSYCLHHCCMECGETGTVSGRPRLDHSNYCLEHKCRACGGLRVDGSDYCVDHICRLCVTESADWLCRDMTCEGSLLCADHRCAEVNCYHSKLRPDEEVDDFETTMLFCREHTCRVCYLIGDPCVRPVMTEYPRNVCEDHPLCQRVMGSGSLCYSQSLPNSCFCAEHEADEKHVEEKDTDEAEKFDEDAPLREGDGVCCGIAKKSKQRCKTIRRSGTGGDWYCEHHVDQAPVVKAVQKTVGHGPEYAGDGYEGAVLIRLREIPERTELRDAHTR